MPKMNKIAYTIMMLYYELAAQPFFSEPVILQPLKNGITIYSLACNQKSVCEDCSKTRDTIPMLQLCHRMIYQFWKR